MHAAYVPDEEFIRARMGQAPNAPATPVPTSPKPLGDPGIPPKKAARYATQPTMFVKR